MLFDVKYYAVTYYSVIAVYTHAKKKSFEQILNYPIYSCKKRYTVIILFKMYLFTIKIS